MRNNVLVNCDTDSTMIAKPNGLPWTKEEREKFLEALNSNFPDLIRWEDDGYYSSVVVVKSKNYALLPEGETKIKTKGSSIRDQKKEPALREMMDKLIESMIYGKQNEITIYEQYVKEALNVKDIRRWCTKKTLTESIFNCKDHTQEDIDNKTIRKNEADVWDAVKNEEGLQEGDKAYLYPVILGHQTIPGGISEKTGKPLKDKVKEINGLKMDKYWQNDHDVEKLLERCYATVKIFKTVLDMNLFIDYSSKKNKHLLDQLRGNNETC